MCLAASRLPWQSTPEVLAPAMFIQSQPHLIGEVEGITLAARPFNKMTPWSCLPDTVVAMPLLALPFSRILLCPTKSTASNRSRSKPPMPTPLLGPEPCPPPTKSTSSVQLPAKNPSEHHLQPLLRLSLLLQPLLRLRSLLPLPPQPQLRPAPSWITKRPERWKEEGSMSRLQVSL